MKRSKIKTKRTVKVRLCDYCGAPFRNEPRTPDQRFCGMREHGRGYRRRCQIGFNDRKKKMAKEKLDRGLELEVPLKPLVGKQIAPEDIPLDILESW